jgi:tetratricopeptide (TPR) repeat protein
VAARRLDLDGTFREALAHHQGGRLADAERLYRSILKAEPNHFDSLHLLGVVQAQSGRPGEALRHLDAAVKIDPRAVPVLNNRGNILKDLGRLDEAVASYDAAIAVRPDYADAHANRGHALLALRRLAEALASYDRALNLRPSDVEACLGRGACLMDMGRPAEALASYDRFVALVPDHPQGHCIRAGALFATRQFADALASCDRALALAPGYAEVHFLRGNVLLELKRHEDAVASFERAVALQPDYAEAHNNCGHALRALGRLAEALASYDRALALKPDYVGALNNRGIVLGGLNRLDEALASYDRALALDPDYADAHMNRALARLLLGRFAEAWPDYEWRWRQTGFPSKKPDVDAPWWQGEDLSRRRLLVFSEQGFGDVVQFARYLPRVAQLGGKTTLLVNKKLSRLLRPMTEGIDVVDAPDGAYDVQCALLSLPYRFGTDLDSIPATVPYLRAEPDLVDAWRNRIGQHGFKIGIAWQAAPGAGSAADRSIPLTQFAPLARLPGVRLISLQKHVGLDQLATLPDDLRIEMPGEGFDDGPDAFIDTAAVMANLDLVIAADTVIVHLAGALARPVWVALPHVPDWRWMLDRQDYPWYPTARLFRQKQLGEWDQVFAEMTVELRVRLQRGQVSV